MNQELLKRIDALAAKLGTTASYLWAVMVRQAVATGYADLVTALMFAVIGCTSAFALRYFIKASRLDDNQYKDWPMGCAIGAGFAILICFGIAVGFGYSAGLELANPAGWALQHILGVGQ